MCIFAGTHHGSIVETDETKIDDFINYITKSKDKSISFPSILTKKDVYVYSFASGKHEVLWEGNDSLLLVKLRCNRSDHSVRTVVVQFTVKPSIPKKLLQAAVIDWAALIKNRKITQYHIVELIKSHGNKSVLRRTLAQWH